MVATLSNREYYWYWWWKRDNPEAKWGEFDRAICDVEEKRVKQEIREKSLIPMFNSGNVGSWLWRYGISIFCIGHQRHKDSRRWKLPLEEAILFGSGGERRTTQTRDGQSL